ncbi:hypothetical protein V5799_004646 [Amblyomma americanum]|uniref:Uncharacterized protein n=1 Tax=Amblyomma americanum TaxID=6943 RepID=A0AAQ4D5I1_AMBAM
MKNVDYDIRLETLFKCCNLIRKENGKNGQTGVGAGTWDENTRGWAHHRCRAAMVVLQSRRHCNIRQHTSTY